MKKDSGVTAWKVASVILLVLFVSSIYYFTSQPEEECFYEERELILNISPKVGYERYDGISHSIFYDGDGGDTNFLVAQFNDSSGYDNKKCYRVLHRTLLKDNIICDECSENTSGELRCNIQEVDGSGLLIGSLYGNPQKGGATYWIDQDDDLYKIIFEHFNSK
ncbi:hypothetical protein LCGC14_0442030 [marine sediment metagenome]|uniref:Uncharacterized protein n=1 Tax=marine sediment metagenome TaxID=412755 RepID=A0A0F9SR45_9ZZZZ